MKHATGGRPNLLRKRSLLLAATTYLTVFLTVLATTGVTVALAQEQAATTTTTTTTTPQQDAVQADCSAELASIASLKATVSSYETSTGELEKKLLEITTKTLAEADKNVKERQVLVAKVGALETSLGKELENKRNAVDEKGRADSKIADLEREISELNHKISTLERERNEEERKTSEVVCLPPSVSKHVIKVRDEWAPLAARRVREATERCVEVAGAAKDRAALEYAKHKPVVLEYCEEGKRRVEEAARVAGERAAPLVEKVRAAAEPYYSPLLQKLDEVTKPYQPQLRKAWDGCKAQVAALRLKAEEVYGDLKRRYVHLSRTAASAVIRKLAEHPSTAPYVSNPVETEKMVVNTLVHIPAVTLAYLVLSPFLFGTKGKKKNKGRNAARAGRKQGKVPQVGSPGKPAFKPQGSPGGTAFRPNARR